MNPTITYIEATETKPAYYLVVFETLADRTRWLQTQGFHYSPGEHVISRWVRPPSPPYARSILEMTPYAAEHCNELRALCMKVTCTKLKQPKPSKNVPMECPQ